MERGYYAYFTASSGPNSVTWSIVHADGRACTADECGTIDPATGEYVAAIFVGGATRFLVIATSIIDPSDSVAVPLYVSDDRQLTGGPNTVQGQVYSAEAGPVPGLVTVWVDPADRIPYVGFDAKTDELGNFMIRNLPDATVYLTAWSGDHSQPCVTTIDVQGDVNASVELMPASAFDRVDAPRPQSSVLPTWSGTIYETTPNGRQPIYGVSLVVHLFMWDNVVAYTLSDRGGKYFLCNLGPYMWMQWGRPLFHEHHRM